MALSGKGRKRKGAQGEREFLKALKDAGYIGDLERNLMQTRDGGADCLSIDGLAVEVKRWERLAIASWWEQTLRQAADTNRWPALAYRQNRKPWRVQVDLGWLTGEDRYIDQLATITIENFVQRLNAALTSEIK